MIGHNNPPDPIDAICSQYEDFRVEAESWLDGTAVETDGQMHAVDVLRAHMRQWRIDLEAGQKSETGPLYDTYKAALQRWKPTIEDAKRIEAGLVAAVDGYKRKRAAEQAEAERKARAEMEAARLAAEAAAQAPANDLQAQRAAADAQAAAELAQAVLVKVSGEKVKGLRTVTRWEVTDYKAAINWIATRDKPAVFAFIDEYAQKHHKTIDAAWLMVTTEREAY